MPPQRVIMAAPAGAPSANLADFTAANAAFAGAFDGATTGQLPMPPARKALVLTCMDARLHPEKVRHARPAAPAAAARSSC